MTADEHDREMDRINERIREARERTERCARSARIAAFVSWFMAGITVGLLIARLIL